MKGSPFMDNGCAAVNESKWDSGESFYRSPQISLMSRAWTCPRLPACLPAALALAASQPAHTWTRHEQIWVRAAVAAASQAHVDLAGNTHQIMQHTAPGGPAPANHKHALLKRVQAMNASQPIRGLLRMSLHTAARGQAALSM